MLGISLVAVVAIAAFVVLGRSQPRSEDAVLARQASALDSATVVASASSEPTVAGGGPVASSGVHAVSPSAAASSVAESASSVARPSPSAAPPALPAGIVNAPAVSSSAVRQGSPPAVGVTASRPSSPATPSSGNYGF